MSKRVKIKHPWYKYDRVCSYNGVFNFIVGERGNGKTYGAKKMCIAKYLRRKEQFIYLRRYSTELVSRRTFFDDIADEFPDYDFRVMGNEAQCASKKSAGEKKRHWEVMGFFVTLSKTQAQKSVSYSKVTTIIFDEFIIEKGVLRYLPEEWRIFQNFYATVDRNQDKTRVYLLANSVSIMNPYFLHYDIRPHESGEFVVKNDGFIVAHFIDSDDFAESVYNTRWGKFIQGTEYAAYAVENEFSDSHGGLVDSKTERAKYMYTLETPSGEFSVWFDMWRAHYYVQERSAKQQRRVTLIPENVDERTRFVTRTDPLISPLRTAWRNGRVAFDSPIQRNKFVEVFKI